MVQVGAMLFAGSVELTMNAPLKKTGLNMTCSWAPGRLAYQPNCVLPELQDVLPCQQICKLVPSFTAELAVLPVKVCCCKAAVGAVEETLIVNGADKPVAAVARLAYCALALLFHAVMFQSHTP